jgi:hypothetical protein
VDHCFFHLDRSSVDNTFESFWKVVNELSLIEPVGVQGEKQTAGEVTRRRRPVLTFVAMDTLESVFGYEKLSSYSLQGASRTRRLEGAGILIAKHSTRLKERLSDSVDTYLKLDQIDGALVIYSLKPPSQIYHVAYDYGSGFPKVKLTPVI